MLDALSTLGQAGITELSEHLDLHPNTVRGHVEALLAEGRVVRRKRPGLGRGRPSWVYAAASVSLEYGALAEALIGAMVRAQVSAELIIDQGRGWGAELVRSVDHKSVDGLARLPELLRMQGFSPQPQGDDLLLTRCPLLAVAQQHPEVVCALHQGLIEGALTAMGDSGDAVLQPFSHPDGCWVRRSEPR